MRLIELFFLKMYFFCCFYLLHALQNSLNFPFSLMILHILHVSGFTDPFPFSIIFLAEIVISSVTISSIIFTFIFPPLFFERYWHTAAGVIPSFSAASFCVKPKLLIIHAAISFRITGSPFHIMYSQGVRIIAFNSLFGTYN